MIRLFLLRLREENVEMYEYNKTMLVNMLSTNQREHLYIYFMAATFTTESKILLYP